MTRFDPITSDVHATREQELAVLCERILAGDFGALPEVEWELYGTDKWTEKALQARDGQDFSDIETMLAKESFWQGWMRLSEREQDEWQGFENYFDARRADHVRSPVDCTDAIRFPNIALARAEFAARPAAERARLNAEWEMRNV